MCPCLLGYDPFAELLVNVLFGLAVMYWLAPETIVPSLLQHSMSVHLAALDPSLLSL